MSPQRPITDRILVEIKWVGSLFLTPPTETKGVGSLFRTPPTPTRGPQFWIMA